MQTKRQSLLKTRIEDIMKIISADFQKPVPNRLRKH